MLRTKLLMNKYDRMRGRHIIILFRCPFANEDGHNHAVYIAVVHIFSHSFEINDLVCIAVCHSFEIKNLVCFAIWDANEDAFRDEVEDANLVAAFFCCPMYSNHPAPALSAHVSSPTTATFWSHSSLRQRLESSFFRQGHSLKTATSSSTVYHISLDRSNQGRR
jgi:hypothetical protein